MAWYTTSVSARSTPRKVIAHSLMGMMSMGSHAYGQRGTDTSRELPTSTSEPFTVAVTSMPSRAVANAFHAATASRSVLTRVTRLMPPSRVIAGAAYERDSCHGVEKKEGGMPIAN